jgi:hypothetical protein
VMLGARETILDGAAPKAGAARQSRIRMAVRVRFMGD